MGSNILKGSWASNPLVENISTAVDTRSLSISLLPGVNVSSSQGFSNNATTNVALLYYENPNGNVSALLERTVPNDYDMESMVDLQWITITSQESKALPDEFRNAPALNDEAAGSHTLYEANTMAVFSTPFLNSPSFPGSLPPQLFYSPYNLNATSPLAGGSICTLSYTIGVSGPGNFSTDSTHDASS